jgi:phenylalanyl-tRNA synthetase beta chain
MDDRALEYVMGPKVDALSLRNPLTEDHAILRPSLISGLLRAAERNFNRGSPGVALFEIGRVFQASGQEESLKLGLVVSGERQSKSWHTPEASFDLFDLKGILEAVTGVEFVLTREEPTRFVPLICNIVDVRGHLLGKVGQVRPGLAKELGARDTISIAELDLPVKGSNKRFVYKEPDRFPPILRDVAFLAGKELKYQSVVETLRASREPLLKEVSLFDLFIDVTGEKVPSNKKSMACSLTYRASDRTLTQEEVNQVHSRLKSLLVKQFDVVLRE